MNLILALGWFCLGVGALGWEFVTGKPGILLVGKVSVAWLAFPLCLYNLARWWGEQVNRRQRRALEMTHARWDREARRGREPGGDIDPNFNFTADPPPRPNVNVTEQPPRHRPNITDQPPSLN